MAKINNQAVMQKLINDLNLYPGKDVIPTELAEKVLPVFNVNEQDVNVDVKTKNINVIETATLNYGTALTTTIYTTPSTGKFYLTNMELSAYFLGGTHDTYGGVDIKAYVGGVQKVVASLPHLEPAATSGVTNGREVVIALQCPIIIDAGTIISLNRTVAPASVTEMGTKGFIMGYLE